MSAYVSSDVSPMTKGDMIPRSQDVSPMLCQLADGGASVDGATTSGENPCL